MLNRLSFRSWKTRSLVAGWVFAVMFFVWALPSTAQERPRLLITVDDLPLSSTRLHQNDEDRLKTTKAMLAVLAKHNIRAVGLVTWRNMRNDTDRHLLDLWLAEGHELGNHSFHHRSYTRTEFEDFRQDVESARQELVAFLEPKGHKLRFFRFPLLHEGNTLEKLQAMREYLRESGQVNLPVTLDNADWTFEKPWVEAQRSGNIERLASIAEDYQESLRLSIRYHEQVGYQLRGRMLPQILLLHATAIGAAQWDALFSWLAERGYQFASADQVLADDVFREPHQHISPKGFGLWDRLLFELNLLEARLHVAEAILQQARAWNGGDLQAFTDIYSEDCAFVSPTGLSQGRQQVLERYQKRYPNKASMGHLTLEVLSFDPIWGIETSMVGDSRPSGIHGASVVGRWKLAYPGDPEREDAEGLTLLVFKQIDNQWKIVRDASM